MKKVSKQMSMEISGGHTVVAYPRNGPDNEYEASRPGVAGWVRKCPAKGHTTCHEYSGLTYDPNMVEMEESMYVVVKVVIR